MPLLAVVWLRDDDAAREFIEEESTGRVVGLYRFPKRDVKLCRGFSGGCRRDGWKRHRFGHWAHGCNLRDIQWWRTLSMTFIDRLGINLLPREETPRIFQNPEAWEESIQLDGFGDIPVFSTKKRPHPDEG